MDLKKSGSKFKLSERMNEIAEKGYAAHYKYKQNDSNNDETLEDWIGEITSYG